jgi:hypothetical protein
MQVTQLSQDDADLSLSWGTLLTEDLIDSFMDFLHAVKHQCCIAERVDKIQAELDTLEREDYGWRWAYVDADREKADWILHEDIGELLNEIAPDGCYFGAHPGDGSDIGFWRSEDV